MEQKYIVLELEFTFLDIDCISMKLIEQEQWNKYKNYLETHNFTMEYDGGTAPLYIPEETINEKEILNNIICHDDINYVTAFKIVHGEEFYNASDLLGEIFDKIKEKFEEVSEELEEASDKE